VTSQGSARGRFIRAIQQRLQPGAGSDALRESHLEGRLRVTRNGPVHNDA
jgi:hypothetical protein